MTNAYNILSSEKNRNYYDIHSKRYANENFYSQKNKENSQYKYNFYSDNKNYQDNSSHKYKNKYNHNHTYEENSNNNFYYYYYRDPYTGQIVKIKIYPEHFEYENTKKSRYKN